MEPKTRRRLEKVIAEAVALAGDGMDEFDAARDALTAQTTDVLRELAVAALVDTIRRHRRSDVLDIERRASGSSSRVAQETTAGWTPRSYSKRDPEYRQWVAETSEGKAYDAAATAAHAEITRRHYAAIRQSIEQLESELKIIWTADLLASDFALPDGTRVTWGDATVEQHEERVALFQRNAAANAEGAARHLHALKQLREHGVATLSQLVKEAA